MELQLRISGYHYNLLKHHLLPLDGQEAVAVALCGRLSSTNYEVLLVHDLTLIPYDQCNRKAYELNWPTGLIHHYFERLGKSSLGLLKIHSHPNNYNDFSKTDDQSDYELFNSVFGWAIDNKPHASAVMLSTGEIFGRFYFHDLHSDPINKILIAGDEILSFPIQSCLFNDDFALRTIQAFGEKTYQTLKKMTIAVVGCSGTGSPVIEQLVRLGVGKIILIDPDVIEDKNLNRILNATVSDASEKKPKVLAIAEAVERIGLGTTVVPRQKNLFEDVESLRLLATCDVIFGCIDTVDGRYLLNQLCSFYLVPYFDLGVKLEADGQGSINQICATFHFLQPFKSSLLTRGVYTLEDLRAASQYRKNPKEYENLKKFDYIKNVNVDNPAVISVNMIAASHAINDFLNRIHPYKVDLPSSYASSTIDITEAYIINSNESDFEVDLYLKKRSGRGDMLPFIELPELKEIE